MIERLISRRTHAWALVLSMATTVALTHYQSPPFSGARLALIVSVVVAGALFGAFLTRADGS